MEHYRQLMMNAKKTTYSRLQGEWAYIKSHLYVPNVGLWIDKLEKLLFLFFTLELRVILEEEKRKQEDLQKQLEESEYAQAQLSMKKRQADP